MWYNSIGYKLDEQIPYKVSTPHYVSQEADYQGLRSFELIQMELNFYFNAETWKKMDW